VDADRKVPDPGALAAALDRELLAVDPRLERAGHRLEEVERVRADVEPDQVVASIPSRISGATAGCGNTS